MPDRYLAPELVAFAAARLSSRPVSNSTRHHARARALGAKTWRAGAGGGGGGNFAAQAARAPGFLEPTATPPCFLLDAGPPSFRSHPSPLFSSIFLFSSSPPPR